MVYIIHTAQDAALADRLKADLSAAGYAPDATLRDDPHQSVIALISAASEGDKPFERAILHTLDHSQHLLPVLAVEAPMPKVIEHLGALDLTGGYDLSGIERWLAHASDPHARPPMKVLTPLARSRNRRIGLLLAAAAFAWFLIGLILVGVYGIAAPAEEYNSLDTLVAVTIDAALDRYRPRSTEDAANFAATVQAAPPTARPPLRGTATAQAATAAAATPTPSP